MGHGDVGTRQTQQRASLGRLCDVRLLEIWLFQVNEHIYGPLHRYVLPFEQSIFVVFVVVVVLAVVGLAGGQ